jgi:hypothetical protein
MLHAQSVISLATFVYITTKESRLEVGKGTAGSIPGRGVESSELRFPGTL